MVEVPKFIGLMGTGAAGHNLGGGYYDMAFYRKLEEGSNMSIDSAATNGMPLENSSVGSSDSHTGILNHPILCPVPAANYSVDYSVLRPGHVSHALTDDALAQALMDQRHRTETLENYDECAIDLLKLNIQGMSFAQGTFRELYRGSYKGEDVAVKLLERPENDPELAQLMEPAVRAVSDDVGEPATP